MLSQSHPNFLSHLRISVNKAKSGSDKAIVTLTTVSLGVLCVQTLIGKPFLSTSLSSLPHLRFQCHTKRPGVYERERARE